MWSTIAESRPNGFAFLIGVSQYDQFPPLPAAKNNVERLAELFLTERFEIRPENMRVVVNKGDLADRGALEGQIEQQLKARRADYLIVYYAGHGIVNTNLPHPDELFLALPQSDRD